MIQHGAFWLQWHFSPCPEGVTVSGEVCTSTDIKVNSLLNTVVHTRRCTSARIFIWVRMQHGPTGFSSDSLAAHIGLRYQNNYLDNVSESPKMHSHTSICPSWVILVKYFWEIELYLVPAPAERKETSSGREIRENLEFSIWLNGDKGGSYYEKWLQWQILGTMRGLK